MKLNLGCGTNKIPGYVNVDRAHAPDVVHDLEVFPWPWPDSSVDEIRAHHVLEHLGATPAVFIGVMKEMYRVCKPGAYVDIVVPHPRHDDFLSDPTHVRPITFKTLRLFSKRLNLEWQAEGWSDSKLGLEHDIDFEPVKETCMLEAHIQAALDQGKATQEAVTQAARELNNIVRQIQMVLACIKER